MAEETITTTNEVPSQNEVTDAVTSDAVDAEPKKQLSPEELSQAVQEAVEFCFSRENVANDPLIVRCRPLLVMLCLVAMIFL